MVNFNEILSRFKLALALPSDKEVAKLFNISQPDFSRRKKRGTLLDLIVEHSIAQKVNLHWLLAGEGEPHAKDLIEGQAREEKSEIDIILDLTRQVLTSDNRQAADALEKNIRYFAHAIKVEERLEDVEGKLKGLEAFLKKLGMPAADDRKESQNE